MDCKPQRQSRRLHLHPLYMSGRTSFANKLILRKQETLLVEESGFSRRKRSQKIIKMKVFQNISAYETQRFIYVVGQVSPGHDVWRLLKFERGNELQVTESVDLSSASLQKMLADLHQGTYFTRIQIRYHIHYQTTRLNLIYLRFRQFTSRRPTSSRPKRS